MPDPAPREVKIDPDYQRVVLNRNLVGFMSDAKVALRALDDGSFNARADAGRAGTRPCVARGTAPKEG